MGKARMGATYRKQTKAARWEKRLAKENKIGYVSLSPSILKVIFRC